MKTSVKIACVAMISFLLLACKDTINNNAEEIPVMNSMVVSHKKDAIKDFEPPNGIGFIIDKNTLKSAFPNIFDNEQAECNYFAIYYVTGTSSPYYWILSQDVILYQIKPGSGTLIGTTDIIYSAMLVCDSTQEGNLKDRIDLNSTRGYTDPGWNYDIERAEDRNVFF
jgi:hypothetical protein